MLASQLCLNLVRIPSRHSVKGTDLVVLWLSRERLPGMTISVRTVASLSYRQLEEKRRDSAHRFAGISGGTNISTRLIGKQIMNLNARPAIRLLRHTATSIGSTAVMPAT